MCVQVYKHLNEIDENQSFANNKYNSIQFFKAYS